MAGLFLNTGLTSGYQGPSYGGLPAAAGASPQGPTSVGQKAFGITTGGGGGMSAGHIGLISAGTVSLVALLWIYWSLPR